MQTAANVLRRAFSTGDQWIRWLTRQAADTLELDEDGRRLIELRARGLAVPCIAATVGLPDHTVRNRFAAIGRAADRVGATTLIAAASCGLGRPATRAPVIVLERDTMRQFAWLEAARASRLDAVTVDRVDEVVHAAEDRPCILVASPFVAEFHRRRFQQAAIIFSTIDRATIDLENAYPGSLVVHPHHDPLPLALAHAAATLSSRSEPAHWYGSAEMVRAAFVDAVVAHGSLSRAGQELVAAWILAENKTSIADMLGISTDAVESRTSAVNRALGIPRLTALPLAAAAAIDGERPPAQPSPAQPRKDTRRPQHHQRA